MQNGRAPPEGAEVRGCSNLENSMTAIRDCQAAAIRDADERFGSRMRADRASTAEAAAAFTPVREAAIEFRDELEPTADMEFAINPDSACISFADRELWFSYESKSHQFSGEESAHSCCDGERFAMKFMWSNAASRIDAMTRSSIQCFRMARAIDAIAELDWQCHHAAGS